MSNTVSDLEQRLARIGLSRFSGQRVARRGISMSGRARALCRPVEYTLPGAVPAIRQSAPATSWAALATMMLAWRDDRPYTVEEALASVHSRWAEAYARGTALTADETAQFIATAGLCTAPPQSLSAEGWEAMLRTYGPLCVVPGEGDVVFPSRGRIVTSVQGDGTPGGTQLGFVDSSTGAAAREPLSAFAGPLRVVHWAADAGLARGVRPTAPAVPAPTKPEAARSGAAGVRMRRRLAWATDVPEWDRPANFPDAIRRFWANLNSRAHHFVWHDARVNWPNLEPDVLAMFNRLRFTPPPRRVGEPGAGVDFLNMHRHMMAATRGLSARLGVAYRPTGWNPIPWNHNDPIWPMPRWSSTPVFKDPERTLNMRARGRDQFENPAWLAGVTLDELGSMLEATIHNWMHMHWAMPEPADPADLWRTDPSNDWLGFTFTSQVNPIFWKLHGWIDACIDLWEDAPVRAGTGQRRSAAADFARFNWIGPVPTPPATDARARSLAGMDHGNADITEEELQALVRGIDPRRHQHFASANLSSEELVARFGPVGEIPIAWREEVEGRSAMASVRGRRVAIGFDRHGARQLGGPLAAVELGIAVFSALQPLVSGGDFSYEAQVAEYVHPNTPPETPASRTTVDFRVTASHPRIGIDDQQFWFTLQFDHNGYDLKNCRIAILRDQSSTLVSSTFHIAFHPVASSAPAEPQARITYVINGRWDPVGSGDYSFEGELVLRADGTCTIAITRADENRVWAPGDTFTNRRDTALPGPTIVASWHDVFFSPAGSDRIVEGAERQLLDWLGGQLGTDIGPNLRNGATPIQVHGHASTTGELGANRDLSRRRAERVERVLRDTLGPNARIEIFAHGEREAGTPDEAEDATKRRVRVEFRKYVWPR